MSADSLAVALMAIEDPGIREAVRGGDMSVFHEDVQLSAKEEQLIKDAAAEELDPEVAGFDASSSAFYRAASQVQGNVMSGPVQSGFTSFMNGKFGGIGSMMGGGCVCPPMNMQSFGGYSQ